MGSKYVRMLEYVRCSILYTHSVTYLANQLCFLRGHFSSWIPNLDVTAPSSVALGGAEGNPSTQPLYLYIFCAYYPT